MTETTKSDAQICRDAAAYIAEYGLRQDGDYGVKGGPCCTIGALSVVEGVDPMFLPDLFRDALLSDDKLNGFSNVAEWNDSVDATQADAIALLNRTADRLEAQS